jgi:thiol:disulfide interchange protein DsbC
LRGRAWAAVLLLAAAACACLALGTDRAAAEQAGSAAPKSAAAASAPAADPRAAIAKRLEVAVDAVRPSALPGIYEVAHGGEVLYVSGDGRYALSGEMFETASGRNLTEQRRTEARGAALHALSDADTIIFGPKTARYTVTVFTDIDCPYCRRMHSEIAEYNRLGVRVRYAFYPRSGPGTESWKKAESVWCAPDRQDALTRAKAGADVPPRSCKGAPVTKTWELGRELGIRGTPGVFTERGDYLSGYLPPQRLLERLKQLDGTGPDKG